MSHDGVSYAVHYALTPETVGVGYTLQEAIRNLRLKAKIYYQQVFIGRERAIVEIMRGDEELGLYSK